LIKKIKAVPLSLATLIKKEVLNNTFSQYGDWDNILMISIQNSDFAPLFKEEELKDNGRLLSLHFDDTTPKATRNLSHLLADKFMDSRQADDIFEFLEDWHKDEKNNLLIVHCHAGVCRSGAIASFAQHFCDVNGYMFQADNPNIQPNRWVEEKMYEAFCNRHPVHKKVEGIFSHG
jgi:predicted protein tyrosine phosphatase